MLKLIRTWRERNYEILDNSNNLSFCVEISKNTINEARLLDKLIILKGSIRFINRGHITGIIYSENGEVVNEGKIEGVVYCETKAYRIKKKSYTSGQVLSDRLIVQPESILDGTVSLGVDESNFISALEQSEFSFRKEEILAITNK